MLTTSLADLKVVDFTQITAGPTCTLMLAGLGADVVKVEAPAGELGRAFFPFVNGESVSFMSLNRNKRSIALDLKNSEHVRVARELIADADIVVESFRPGVMERLSLDYPRVSADHPRLIYCSISAYGQESPWKDKPGVDGVVQAVSGLMSVTGLPGQSPCKVQVPVVDIASGYLATVAVLGALAQRHRTGKGERLDISMFASAIALQQSEFATYFSRGTVPQLLGSATPYSAPNEALRCSDGWIMVAAYHPERWDALCRVLNAPELAGDPCFADSASRVANRGRLIQVLDKYMSKHDKNHWLNRFQAADIICGPINHYGEVVSSAPFVHADLSETLHHPLAGKFTAPRFPLASLGEKAVSRRPAPLLGQHTREVLKGLGYAPEAIEKLLAREVLAGVEQE